VSDGFDYGAELTPINAEIPLHIKYYLHNTLLNDRHESREESIAPSNIHPIIHNYYSTCSYLSDRSLVILFIPKAVRRIPTSYYHYLLLVP